MFIYTHAQFTICVHKRNLQKILLAPDRNASNYCGSRGVYYLPHSFLFFKYTNYSIVLFVQATVFKSQTKQV